MLKKNRCVSNKFDSVRRTLVPCSRVHPTCQDLSPLQEISGGAQGAQVHSGHLLENQGARISVFKCDVSNIGDLDRVLEHSSRDMPPIRGLLPCALVSKVETLNHSSMTVLTF